MLASAARAARSKQMVRNGFIRRDRLVCASRKDNGNSDKRLIGANLIPTRKGTRREGKARNPRDEARRQMEEERRGDGEAAPGTAERRLFHSYVLGGDMHDSEHSQSCGKIGVPVLQKQRGPPPFG